MGKGDKRSSMRSEGGKYTLKLFFLYPLMLIKIVIN